MQQNNIESPSDFKYREKHMEMHFLKSCSILKLILVISSFIVCVNGYQLCLGNLAEICECPTSSTIRCLFKNLIEYPDLSAIQHTVQELDMSFNQLMYLPRNLHRFNALETLDLSHNRIEMIASNTIFPVNLRQLILSNNNISNWLNINPNTIFHSAINLQTLNLSGNPIHSINGNDEQSLLISGSLRVLDLSGCQLIKITGPLFLNGMIKLEHFIIKSNPLTNLPDFKADNLMRLDASACKLTKLRRKFFSFMPMLTYVNLSNNHRLTLNHDGNEYVESDSIRWIDLTHCFMDTFELNGMPNVTTVLLRGNSLTQLTGDSFEMNERIESLDLSYNAITSIDATTFQHMKRLRVLDLSFNMIRGIDRNTFRMNSQLTKINLSRNTMDRFRSIVSDSLTYFNLSWCEVLTIDHDALDYLPKLIELDLSNNLIDDLPPKLKSPMLQILDLSRCRLSNVENETFAGLTELSRLNLAGNRLTATFHVSYFASNAFLNEIWMADNPWHCDCDGNGFKEFHRYLIEFPQKVKDRLQLRCISPKTLYGKLWEDACYNDWYASTKQPDLISKISTILMVVFVNLMIMYIAIFAIKRWINYRREVGENQRRQENLETTRELMRHNQMVLEQESQLNAPDPRETHPPCYEDAIRLPRLIRSTISLKRVDLDSHDIVASQARSRSEENFSGRSSFAIKTTPSPIRLQSELNTLYHIQPAGIDEPNEQQRDHNQRQNSGRYGCSSKQSIIEVIHQLDGVDGNSPYAKRKINTNNLALPTTSMPSTSAMDGHSDTQSNDIVMVENHYHSEGNLNQRNSTESSSYSSSTPWSSSSFNSAEFFKISTNTDS